MGDRAPDAVWWTFLPEASVREVNRLARGLAAELEIPPPQIKGRTVGLPRDLAQVVAALDRVDPRWWQLICPPPGA